jgi:hypothetical protein
MSIPAIVVAGNPATASPVTSDAVLRVAMHESILRTHARSAEIRPANTSKAYSARHLEFQQWCSEKMFVDGFVVTGDKLHLFLEEKVIGRIHRKRRRNFSDPVRKVGKSTVFGYATAMVDLWRQQKAMGMNTHPSPRDANVKALLKNSEYETQRNRRENFVDRGIGTLTD